MFTALTLIIQCVQITKLVVPEIVSLRDAPVILDCDYTLQSESDDELIVKWFFGDPIKLVYQWIPYIDIQPQALGEFSCCITYSLKINISSGVLKGRLDLTYEASPDRLKKHRALKITKLGPELAGNYTCDLSNLYNEDSQTKQMLIFGKSINKKILNLLKHLYYRVVTSLEHYN